MAKYVDKNVWVEQVMMPDESTPILGGAPDWDEDNMLAGWSNVPTGQLADRTRFLKDKVEALEQEIEAGGSNALQKDNNLSDLQDVGQAKFNMGLNLVDNTRDLDKPISDLTQDALDEKVDKEAGKGLSSNDFTTAEKNKLSGIQAGATANATNAQLRDRSTHTGEQPISTITGLQTALNEKVDKVTGMGLSQESFTTSEKNKLAGLESSKFKGEFISLAALQSAFPTTEVGSYAYVDQGVGQDVVKYIWDSTDTRWVLQQGESAVLTPADVKSLYEANADTNAFTDAEKTKLSGIANNANNYVHPNSGVSTGTYKSVTVNAQGHVTGGSNPSTLSGYGITDAAPSSHVGSTGSAHGAATTSVAGFMSSADKQKLDGIQAGAQVNAVTSVAGKTGAVTVTKADVSLGNVDNTADSVKNVASAAKLTTARNISATGDANWSVSFDGSGNSTAALTLVNTGVTAGTYPKVTVDAKGRVTTGASLTATDVPNLDAGKITSGTLADARLPSTVARLSQTAQFTGNIKTNYNLIASTGIVGRANVVSGFESTSQGTGTTAGAALITFHRPSSFSTFFGIDVDNQLKVGGWSMGDVAYKIWHEGSDGAGSGLDADLLDGQHGSFYQNASNLTTGTIPAARLPALNASKAQVLNGTNNSYVSGGTYLNVISWNNMGSLSANTSINLDTSLNHSLTAAASLTLDATNVDPGKTGDIVINTPTAVTVSWAAKWKFLGSVPNIGGAGETWVVSYKVFDANTIYAAAVKVA